MNTCLKNHALINAFKRIEIIWFSIAHGRTINRRHIVLNFINCVALQAFYQYLIYENILRIKKRYEVFIKSRAYNFINTS